MRFFKIILINIIFLVLFLEITSFFIIKFTFFPNGLHTGAVLRADETFSVWHPKNFKIKLATKCWESEVKFNSLGLKQTNEIGNTKKKIAILGDSMTENLQSSNENDFRSKLQNLLPNYEIINFSVASTGLADQIKIYKNLIKKYEVDYVFLYPTSNDLEDNFIKSYRPYRTTYKYEDEKIIKLEKNKKFFENYNSIFNRFKRNQLMEIKKISSFYKVYAYTKYVLIPNRDYEKKQKKNIEPETDYSQNEIIFEYILENAEKEIFNEVETLIFLNLPMTKDYKKPLNLKIMTKILSKYDFFYDPYEDSIKFMKDRNKFKPNYLSHSCDTHYTDLGTEFLANYTYKIFKNEYNLK